MTSTIELGEITVDVVRKDIKNIHLSVYPPTGRVRISAPSHLNLNTIRAFAISKLTWIKQQQKKFQEQERETPREYLMTRQCLSNRRIGNIETLQREISAWSTAVNASQRGVEWQMKVTDARRKLKSVYPKIES